MAEKIIIFRHTAFREAGAQYLGEISSVIIKSRRFLLSFLDSLKIKKPIRFIAYGFYLESLQN